MIATLYEIIDTKEAIFTASVYGLVDAKVVNESKCPRSGAWGRLASWTEMDVNVAKVVELR